MSSDYDQSLVDQILDEALNDSVSKNRTYGQLGYMETELVSNIFNALESKLSNASFLEVLQDSRINTTALKNSTKITDLHTVTHNCRKCLDAGMPSSVVTPTLPKWNTSDPDVLFIIDSPSMDQQASSLFVSALKTAEFSSEKVCLTYLVRCPTKSIEKQYIDNCINYLHTEIQIMNPKLVCTIGANVLSALLGMEAKIKDYKNKILWLGSWPILPLYSLNYIVKAGDSAVQSFQSDMNQAYQFCYKKALNHDSE